MIYHSFFWNFYFEFLYCFCNGFCMVLLFQILQSFFPSKRRELKQCTFYKQICCFLKEDIFKKIQLLTVLPREAKSEGLSDLLEGRDEAFMKALLEKACQHEQLHLKKGLLGGLRGRGLANFTAGLDFVVFIHLIYIYKN